MNPLIFNTIKYGLLLIVFVVVIFRVWQVTAKIVKKFKGKDDFKLDIEDIGG